MVQGLAKLEQDIIFERELSISLKEIESKNKNI
jgi:hypothetical protein